ncbi:MAG: hypothetical protein ACJ788_22370 [Ktedonobacteraceae bacterium]
MQFVVEYRLVSGSRGIMLFTEDNEVKAAEFVADLINGMDTPMCLTPPF